MYVLKTQYQGALVQLNVEFIVYFILILFGTRWKLVIHAGVDGFSRMIVFVKCSDNNRASTMLESFLEGASSYGLPSRVRTDHTEAYAIQQ